MKMTEMPLLHITFIDVVPCHDSVAALNLIQAFALVAASEQTE